MEGGDKWKKCGIHTKYTTLNSLIPSKPEQLERKRESECAEKEDDGHEVNI